MQIKIRAWDKDSETMIYGVGITPESDGGIPYQIPVNAHDFDQLDYYPNSIIMLYTGLKDKNGKEIYEGDIAKSRKRLFVARWNNDIASFVWESLDGENSHPCFNVGTVKNMEIVGNIYEHPHLLGGEEE